MKRLTIEVTQAPLEPQKIKVSLSNQKGRIEGAVQETTLPWGDDFALPIVLKLLDKSAYSANLFNDQEREWLLQNRLAYKFKEDYFYDENLQKTIGGSLYQALLGDQLQPYFKHAYEEAKQANEPLHLEIKFGQEAGLIGAYPWELLFDGVDFLCRGGTCLLTRYIMEDMEDKSTAPVRSVPNKLKILVVSPRPNTPDVEKLERFEPGAVLNAFRDFNWDQSVNVTVLEPPTFSQLSSYLQENRGEAMPHIFHFDGHGVFGRRCPVCGEVETSAEAEVCQCGHPLLRSTPQGFLVFEDEQGGSNYVSGEQLADQLRMAVVLSQDTGVSSEGLCLAVLSACESAFLQGRSVFNGVAQRLIHARIPAVVAMQFTVTETDALEFVNTFYQRIAESQPLVKAVLGGRSKLLIKKQDQWYRPVLYLRWREHEGGRLFDIGPAMRYPGGPAYFVRETKQPERDKGTAKIAVDQIAVITDFVQMLVPEWRKNIDWRLLLLEGKEHTGKTTVLERFERCCKKVQETVPLLYALIKLEDKVSVPLSKFAANSVQKLITSAEGLPELDTGMGKLKEFLDELNNPPESRSSGLNVQDPQALGREFYKRLNVASQGYTVVLLLDNFDALFPVENGQGLKSFISEMAEGVKEAEYPNTIFTAVTSARSLHHVPNDLEHLEKTIDMTVFGNVKYHQAVSQIGVEEVRELAKEEFGIEIVDGEDARELIELARASPDDLPDIRYLRKYLASPRLRDAYLAGGG